MAAHFCILTHSLLPKLLDRFFTAESECCKIMPGLTALGEQLHMLMFAFKTFLFLLSPSFVTPCFCCLFCPTSILTALSDNVDIPGVLGPEHYLGLLSTSRREKCLNPAICTGIFMIFSFSLQYFSAFLPHTHFCIQILQCCFPVFTFKSYSTLP